MQNLSDESLKFAIIVIISSSFLLIFFAFLNIIASVLNYFLLKTPRAMRSLFYTSLSSFFALLLGALSAFSFLTLKVLTEGNA